MSKRPADRVALTERLVHQSSLEVAEEKAAAGIAASDLADIRRGISTLRRAGSTVLADRCAPILAAAEKRHKTLADTARHGEMVLVELQGRLSALKAGACK